MRKNEEKSLKTKEDSMRKAAEKSENQSCAGAPRCKQQGMFASPLQIPLKKTVTQKFSLSRT
jgi:hypothetical protein